MMLRSERRQLSMDAASAAVCPLHSTAAGHVLLRRHKALTGDGPASVGFHGIHTRPAFL